MFNKVHVHFEEIFSLLISAFLSFSLSLFLLLSDPSFSLSSSLFTLIFIFISLTSFNSPSLLSFSFSSSQSFFTSSFSFSIPLFFFLSLISFSSSSFSSLYLLLPSSFPSPSPALSFPSLLFFPITPSLCDCLWAIVSHRFFAISRYYWASKQIKLLCIACLWLVTKHLPNEDYSLIPNLWDLYHCQLIPLSNKQWTN